MAKKRYTDLHRPHGDVYTVTQAITDGKAVIIDTDNVPKIYLPHGQYGSDILEAAKYVKRHLGLVRMGDIARLPEDFLQKLELLHNVRADVYRAQWVGDDDTGRYERVGGPLPEPFYVFRPIELQVKQYLHPETPGKRF